MTLTATSSPSTAPSGEEGAGGVWAWEDKGADRWSDAGRIGSTAGRGIAADLTGDGRADLVTGSSVLVARPTSC